MDRNKRVIIFLTACALSVIACIGFAMYMTYGFTNSLRKTVKQVHITSKELSPADTIVILNRNVDDLKAYVLRYQPTTIDFSVNDTLNTFDLEYIYSRKDEKSVTENDEIANILLLKLYLSHLKDYHQGYDLLLMRKGQAKYIIDYYFQSNKIDTIAEMYNTGSIYKTIEAKKEKSKILVDFLKSIEPEQNRIEIYFKELDKKNH